ncbi:hypothetical protein AB0J38_23710 [Streptomyces sp. NPDC050095]|uniref:hypothetical protein n=1 Tax=unclassified Streptomyces TaxID=2593676 RepID=UPI00343A6F8A
MSTAQAESRPWRTNRPGASPRKARLRVSRGTLAGAVERVAAAIRDTGGSRGAFQIGALDETAVRGFVDAESVPQDFAGRAESVEMLTESTLLGRTATLSDVGEGAAFVAGDRARTMTSATVNVSCGALVDY